MRKSRRLPLYRRVVKELILARISTGLSQAEASRALGMYRTYINKVETVERRLDVVEFYELCGLYGVNPRKLLASIGI